MEICNSCSKKPNLLNADEECEHFEYCKNAYSKGIGAGLIVASMELVRVTSPSSLPKLDILPKEGI